MALYLTFKKFFQYCIIFQAMSTQFLTQPIPIYGVLDYFLCVHKYFYYYGYRFNAYVCINFLYKCLFISLENALNVGILGLRTVSFQKSIFAF